ncbi:MAG: hypothetical protein H6867_02220 [Rhodospirillales bacterium]|nr:hypothetical protein [Rhodospirillales bacterium]MCB9997003.1 hypothetical protein [Rhodospirillales bacterium]
MSNTTDNIFEFQAGHSKPCRIAYTLNNRQPVLCSYISDQPLFYMDFEGAIDDEEDYGYFDFTAVEDGVADLYARLTALERFEDGFEEHDDLERIAALGENIAAITQPFEAGENDSGDIRFLEQSLRESRFAASLLDFAAKYETKLHYAAETETAIYDRRDGQIYINPHMNREDRILMAVRELRRAWQHRNGALLNPLTFHPDQAILVNRAQIADLSVMMVRVAWELQLAGQKDVWERVESSSMADLARAFARESFLDFRTLNNGVAQSAVFESWFLSERCRHEDKKLIQSMLADYRGYVFDTQQASQHITAELIIALGSMPFGKNYLASHVNTIMNDAIFTEVRDRSNANFLWFIKFERSFRETEQELQTDETNTDPDYLSGSSKNKNIRFGDHEQKSEIITLQRGEEPAAAPQAGKAQNGNIVPFRGRSGG